MNLGAEPTSAKGNQLVSSDSLRRLEREFASNGDAASVQRGLTQAVDQVVATAYADAIQPVLAQGAAMLALGEYGRGQLCPHSEVNVLIVLETESPWVALRGVLAEFVRELWDLGLRINHAVRTIAECLDVREENPDLRIGLLNQRFLAGDRYVRRNWKAGCQHFSPSRVQNLLSIFAGRRGCVTRSIRTHSGIFSPISRARQEACAISS